MQIRWSALAVIVFACSVYEEPDLSPSSIGGSGGESGASMPSGGHAGSSGGTANPGGDGVTTAGTSAGSGTGGGTNPGGTAGAGGTGTTPPETAGGMGGAAGSPPDEPAGGAGGEPPVVDTCPNDPNKVTPGTCGCGVPDVATATLADCATLKKKLVHRYDFEGTGDVVTDRIGTAHGTVKNATLSKLDGKGVVRLTGGTTGPYVDLPNKLVSPLTNATVEAWVTWGGGDTRQRIFDFGDTTNATPEDNPGTGRTYFFATPKSDDGVAAGGFSLNANTAEQDFTSTVALPMSLKQVVVVANDTANKLTIYVDGVKSGEIAWTSALASLNDVNVWLGRSQWDRDPEFTGVFHEVRIYNAALTDAEVASAFNSGTDPTYLK